MNRFRGHSIPHLPGINHFTTCMVVLCDLPIKMHGLGKVAYHDPLRFGPAFSSRSPQTTPKPTQVVASVEKESLAVGETEETPS